MKINLEKAWEEIEEDFNPNKLFHLFALVNLTRYTLEKEDLKNWKNDDEIIDFSIIHNFLHFKAIEIDNYSFITSLIDLLIKLPKKYNANEIFTRLIKLIPKEEISFWKITDYPESIHKKYNVKLFSINVFSYFPFFYIYSGKLANDNVITFISDKKFDLYDVYSISVGYGKINKNINLFFEISSENTTKKIQKQILEKYRIEKGECLFELMKKQKWPNHFLDISHRNLIADATSFFAKPFYVINQYEKFYPFLTAPFFQKTPFNLSSFYVEKILKSYGVFPLYKKQYLLKKELDKKNMPYLTKYNKEQKKFDFFKEENNKLYYEEYLKDIQKFKKIFRSIEKNEVFFKKNHDFSGIILKICNKLISERAIIINGPAGYGKSFSLKKIIKFFKAKNQKIKLVCPTWKAIEVYENLIPNSTIKGLEGEDDFFEEIDLLIIDEMTLINDWSFLEKISEKTRIIFSGDPNQLQPLNTSTKKYKWLIECAPKKCIIDFKKEKNYRIEEAENKDLAKIQLSLIEENFLYQQALEGVMYFASDKKIFEKIFEYSQKGFTIISPNNGGLFGVDFINRFLKNKDKDNFEIKDKIVFTKTKKNHYYNGLFGEIINICHDENIYKIKALNGTEININILNENLPFNHAYAINAHKAQGSTIEKVLILVHKNVGYDWLYTAYSRASKNAIIIFKTNSFSEFIKRK